MTKRLQLDKPIYQQYWHFFSGLLHGNLGYSFYHGQSVNSVLKAAVPITVSLVIGAAIIWIVLGVLSGILSAVKSRTIADRAFTGLALFFYSMPTFVLGLLLLLVFYYELTIHGIHAFPATYIPFGAERDRVVPLADPALDHAGAGVGRDLHPADPGLDAGRDERGLHPHRPG